METLILTFDCQTGMGALLAAGLKEAILETRDYDGCELVELYVEAERPDRVVLIEKWQSRQHQVAYMAWRNSTGAMDAISSILTTPPIENWLVSQEN